MNEHCKILYIEDDLVNRALVRKLLKASGYEVIEAEDGLSGIEAARVHRPDLILMDMSMSGLDGYETTAHLKGIPELGAIPVVALTAHAMSGDRERCLTAGCDGYIAKPIDIDTFVSQLESFLTGKPGLLSP